MITALHVPDAERLGELTLPPWAADLPAPTRLYFGVEFCQHLLPTRDDVQAAVAFANERGWAFTLLTPYMVDAFVEGTAALLDVVESALDPEVVVNDWGVLRILEGRAVRSVLGRGLHRQQRDPRLPDVGPEHLGGDEVPDTWKQGSLGSRYFRRFLDAVGVGRVELDAPLHGSEDLPDGVPVSLHLPFGMVASGRICMVSSWGKSASTRFVAPVACDAPCRRFTIELRAPWSRREDGAERLPLVAQGSFIPLSRLLNRRRNALPEPEEDPAPRFLQKGNTHFYELDGERLGSALTWAGRQAAIDRVVIQPWLPM